MRKICCCVHSENFLLSKCCPILSILEILLLCPQTEFSIHFENENTVHKY